MRGMCARVTLQLVVRSLALVPTTRMHIVRPCRLPATTAASYTFATAAYGSHARETELRSCASLFILTIERERERERGFVVVLSGSPGLVVTHFISRFLYFLYPIFRNAAICQSFE